MLNVALNDNIVSSTSSLLYVNSELQIFMLKYVNGVARMMCTQQKKDGNMQNKIVKAKWNVPAPEVLIQNKKQPNEAMKQ